MTIYNPFEKIKRLEKELKVVRGNRDWLQTQIAYYNFRDKELSILIDHWKKVARLSFTAIGILLFFVIYLLGQ